MSRFLGLDRKHGDGDHALTPTGRPRRRLALLLGVVGLLLCASAAQARWPFGDRGRPRPGEDLAGAATDLLARAIRIPTVNPPGDERPLAELLLGFLRREGLEARLVPTPRGASRPGRAAVWARVRGTGERPPVVLLSHLDVVPAEPEEWAFDPFSGTVTAGYVVGRGALDAKGVAVVHSLALTRLAARDGPLTRDVILLATPDEETGGRHGAGILVERHPELLGGAEYLLTEGGGILAAEAGRPNVWGVAVSEKAPCWMRLTARGAPGHASTAGEGGAVPRLVAALDRVRRLETEVRVVPEVARMFAALAPLAAPEDSAGLRRLEQSLATDAAFRQRFLSDPARAALVRDTVAISVLRAGTRPNVIPARAWAELDARLLPGGRCEAFLERIRRVAGDPTLEVEPILSFESRGSPVGTPLFRAIRAVAADVDPEAAVVPRVIAGFTDAHWFRRQGVIAYGFVPRWLPPAESRGIHGPNERISVENLARGVLTLVRVLERLDALDRQAGPA